MKDHKHKFMDCSFCNLNDVCVCGITKYEEQLQEENRRLKAQLKLRYEDYSKTLTELAQQAEVLWAALDETQRAILARKVFTEFEKEKEE